MSSSKEDPLKDLIAHAKEYGFVFRSSEIYDGLAATYDYGPNGVELKQNIKTLWWNSMVRMNENIEGLDSAIFMHPDTWKASGHLEAFNDPMIDNKESKKRYRADQLVEDHIEKQKEKVEKEVQKAAKKFGDEFDEAHFRETNPRVQEREKKIVELEERLKKALDENDLKELKQLIEDLGIACPVSGSKEWTDVRQFNLMFETELGALGDEADKIYLRPETCQGIFVNFLNVLKTSRQKLPFGIAQIGKAFRNEIVARQFIFRMREFEQMEMQFFVKPGEEMEWFEHWKRERSRWHEALGMTDFRLQDHLNLPHYANAATDIEYAFPMGYKELEGIHSRTDHDLKKHEEHSGKKMRYYDPEEDRSYIPYVIETSIGLDRMVLAVLSHSFQKESLEDGSERELMRIPPVLAPVKAAVLPLTRKDGLPEKAQEVLDALKFEYHCHYEEKDSIGKRYRRQDAIGTPYCITVDHDSLSDDTVTLRDRDTMEQERVPIDELRKTLEAKVSMAQFLKHLQDPTYTASS